MVDINNWCGERLEMSIRKAGNIRNKAVFTVGPKIQSIGCGSAGI